MTKENPSREGGGVAESLQLIAHDVMHAPQKATGWTNPGHTGEWALLKASHFFPTSAEPFAALQNETAVVSKAIVK